MEKRVYISADIEGVTGVMHWNETYQDHGEHARAAAQMTREVAAACRGAAAAGADKIWVRDAHDSARNILAEELPEGVALIRGWGGTPESMMEGVGDGFDCALCIGYHSQGGSDANPLAHTINKDRIVEVRINGKIVSELELNTYITAQYGVPIVLVSGDEGICQRAAALYPGIYTAPVKRGLGASAVSMHPRAACEMIERLAKEAVSALPDTVPKKLPEEFVMTIRYHRHRDAGEASYFPGARRLGPDLVEYRAQSVQEMLAAKMFMI